MAVHQVVQGQRRPPAPWFLVWVTLRQLRCSSVLASTAPCYRRCSRRRRQVRWPCPRSHQPGIPPPAHRSRAWLGCRRLVGIVCQLSVHVRSWLNLSTLTRIEQAYAFRSFTASSLSESGTMKMILISPLARNLHSFRVASKLAPSKSVLPVTWLPRRLGVGSFPARVFSLRCFLPAVEPTYSLRLSGRLTVVAPPSPPLSDLPIPLAASPRDLARLPPPRPLVALPPWCCPVGRERVRWSSATSRSDSRSAAATRSARLAFPPRSVPLVPSGS